jgi:Lysyl oxidase
VRGQCQPFVVGLLALCVLGSFGAGAASADPSYRLEFGSRIHAAAGGGPLIVKGHRLTTSDPMAADQVIKRGGGGELTRPNIGQLVYEQYPGSVSHQHWHYKSFDRYQLRSTSDLSIVRPDNKAGFCLSDPVYATDFCGSLKPWALSVQEGLGPDTTDYYNPSLEGQYIDVTGLPAGDYWLLHWVNADKEICESDYANNAAAVKVTLWPSGYGVAPYFTLKDVVEPFPPLYEDLGPPGECGAALPPDALPPDLIQRHPSEVAVTVISPPASTPPQGQQPGAVPTAPTLSGRLARRYLVMALVQRFHRRPAHLRRACRRTGRTSFRCAVRWRSGPYRYRGAVRVFTVRVGDTYERRFALRIRRTNRRCVAQHRKHCTRTVTTSNGRFRRQ